MIEPVVLGDCTLYLGDCLEILPTLAAGSVDAVVTDPPYFNVADAEFDRMWQSLDDYIGWLEMRAQQWRRVLKHNGSLLVFGDDKVIAYVQVMMDIMFLLLNNIVWRKTNNMATTYTVNNRCFTTCSERILFYSAQYDPTGWEAVKLDMNNFLPLREYFRQYQDAIGLNIKQINERLGHRKAEHAFYWGSTQWDLPTPEVYAELCEAFPVNHGFLRREYEDLRREYEDLRREYEDLRREYEDLRRVFNADKKTIDVIEGPIVSTKDNTDHPTTKPLWIMKRLVTVCTNAGATILDPFMGSGTTGVACVQTGRKFIGVEIESKYFEIAVKRISEAQLQMRMAI